MDYNPNSPLILGMEPRPGQAGLLPSQNSNGGALMRFRAGAWTISAVHLYLQQVIGSPGLGIEILDTLVPARTDEQHFPGTNTGATKSAWETLANATSTFVDVADDNDDTDGLRNISQISRNSSIELKFRGADTNLSLKRIDKIEIWVRVNAQAGLFFGASRQIRLRGRVNLGGTDYTYDAGTIIPVDGLTRTVKIAAWRLNPSTNIPWTQTQANALIGSAASDEWGLVADQADIAAEGLRVYGMWAVVTTATENRKGFYYENVPPRKGWAERALSATASLTNNTYYWLHVFALRGSSQSYFMLPILYDPTAVIQSDPTATGEHRLGSIAHLTGPSGLIDEIAADVPGSFFPFLLDSAGTIRDQSWAFAMLDRLTFDSAGASNRGTEITSPGANSYAGVSLPVAWADPNTPPDQPLVIEIRDGGGMLGGAGNLRATATLNARVNPTWPGLDPGMADTFIAFDGGNFTASATQLFALVKSAATPGKGWIVPRLDSRSNDLSSGGGTAQADVQGQTFGGSTDSYSSAVAEDDRYDMPIALVGPPTAPAAPTATVRLAT